MLRNIDWRPADEQPGVLDAVVSLEMEGDATAGERVRLNAEVETMVLRLCTGSACVSGPTVRVRGRGATIPIGFVPPGETARGTVEVAVGPLHRVARMTFISSLKRTLSIAEA